MNPQTDPAPSFGLPRIPDALAPQGSNGMQSASQFTPPAAGSAGFPPIAPAAEAMPTGAVSVPQAAAPGPAVTPAAEPSVANGAEQLADEDSGVLDQEWVEKLKEIVARTHADPYAQSQEVSRLKAQYIKARYNKDIKTVEED